MYFESAKSALEFRLYISVMQQQATNRILYYCFFSRVYRIYRFQVWVINFKFLSYVLWLIWIWLMSVRIICVNCCSILLILYDYLSNPVVGVDRSIHFLWISSEIKAPNRIGEHFQLYLPEQELRECPIG